jgi:hypothetical protein
LKRNGAGELLLKRRIGFFRFGDHEVIPLGIGPYSSHQSFIIIKKKLGA